LLDRHTIADTDGPWTTLDVRAQYR
jgi:hypothetical protein